MMRKIILTVSIALMVLHLVFLIVLNSKRNFIIDISSGFVQYQIEENLRMEFKKVKSSGLYNAVKSKYGESFDAIEERLEYKAQAIQDEIPDLIDEIKLDNGKSKISIIEKVDLRRLYIDRKYFLDWIRFKFDSILRELKTDLSIFLSTNLIVFIVLLAVNADKGRSDKVKMISFAVILSVLVSSSIYLFSQNWFFSLIFNSYYGYSYSILLLFVLGFLLDIGLNKSRVVRYFGVIPV